MRLFKLTSLLLITWAGSVQGQSFTEISEVAGIDFYHVSFGAIGGGIAWFDADGDGDDDLYICGGQDEDRLYTYQGFDTFVLNQGIDLFDTSIRNTMGVVTGDIDNDGFREILVTTYNAGTTLFLQRNLLYYNNGDGTFTEIAEDAGVVDYKYSMPPSFVDINQDGFLDIYIGNYIEDSQLLFDDQNNVIGFDHVCWPDDVYINNGDLTFTKLDSEAMDLNAGCTLAVHPTDFDKNGQVDVMVVNDFGQWGIPNRLYSYDSETGYYNDLAPETGADIGLYGMGLAAGDFDHDLDLDYYCTNIGSKSFLRNSNGIFTEVAEELGVQDQLFGDGYSVGWGTFFFDYNNDSWTDLFLANGHLPAVSWLGNDQDQRNVLWRNQGGSGFLDVTESVLPENLEYSRGCAYADFNNDGALDFGVQTVFNDGDWVPVNFRLYKNETDPGDYVKFKLQGITCNRDAFGARVQLYAGDNVYMDEVQSSSSHMSQNTSTLHFGLNNQPPVDSVMVFWPGGDSQTVTDLNMNAVNIILQDTTTVAPPDTTDNPDEEYPNWIVSLPAGEGLTRLDLKKSFTGFGDLNLFPNPASEAFGISYSLEVGGVLQLDILDAAGRTVHNLWSGEVSDGSHEMQFERPHHLPAGSYLLRLRFQNQHAILRLQLGNP